MLRFLRCFIAVILPWVVTFGQDLHYSQFYYNQQNQNPALIGMFDGDHRISANYRNQWLSVPVPYMSTSILFDSKYRLRNFKDHMGWGVGMDYDRAGDSRLSMAKLQLGLNYYKSVAKKHAFSIGLAPSFAQRRLSEENLKWDVQWNGDRYDPTRSNKENFGATGKFFLDLSGGVAYHFVQSKRTRVSLSAGFYHINKPSQSFYSNQNIETNLPIRYHYGLASNFALFSWIDLAVFGQFQIQDQYQEIVGSSLIRLYVNQKPGSKFNLLLGCGIRLEDAIIPSIGFEYNSWLVSGSYDINTSPFKTATRQRGGPELSVQYYFRSVPPFGIYKKCPIY
ncbi:MAG TPA: PorP/SprF family type IX secretion system membrane protein [Saprospiraceae bacterium]|nr:PorP/SprF family type IX secretion system membrane protein [Saprospiraceae bacterium]